MNHVTYLQFIQVPSARSRFPLRDSSGRSRDPGEGVLSEWQPSDSIQATDHDYARIAVGNDVWRLPIPLVKK
ncbi:DUF2950 family protein [Caballeronia choica]|uniref:DUF2950 family protein n=1 Tax=Caballeronia choica TaxID=326476 RepID=UPI000F7370FE